MGKHEEKGQRQKDGPSRGRNPRTTPVRGIGPEGSRLVWSAAGVYCGRRQSADSCPKSRVLMGQTADHGCGLKPSAVDAKTNSPICFSGQTRAKSPRVYYLTLYFVLSTCH